MKRNVLGPWLYSLLALTLLASGILQSMPAMAASFLGTYATGQGPSAQLTPTANLSYHGGPVMVDIVTTYAIFWEPTGSYVSPTYNSLILQYFNDVGGSSLYHNITQYSNSHGKFPLNSVLGGSWVDTRPYPGSQLPEAQIRHEVTRAMQTNGWTPSVHKIFFVFSAKGEIMCSKLSTYGCTFIDALCAWHGNMKGNTIYAAQPYAGTDLSLCGVPSSPNHDIDADSTISLISHEQFEAATDPFYNGWYDGAGPYHGEIADKCFYWGKLNKYGGDVVWNGHPYEVQEEWDNARSGCVLKGP